MAALIVPIDLDSRTDMRARRKDAEEGERQAGSERREEELDPLRKASRVDDAMPKSAATLLETYVNPAWLSRRNKRSRAP